MESSHVLVGEGVQTVPQEAQTLGCLQPVFIPSVVETSAQLLQAHVAFYFLLGNKTKSLSESGQSTPVRPRPLCADDTAATRWRCRLNNGAARCWCQDEAGVLMAALNKLPQFSQPAGR